MKTFKTLILIAVSILILAFAAVAKSPPIKPSVPAKTALKEAPPVVTYRITTPIKIYPRVNAVFDLANDTSSTSKEMRSLMDYKTAKTFKIFQQPPEVVRLE